MRKFKEGDLVFYTDLTRNTQTKNQLAKVVIVEPNYFNDKLPYRIKMGSEKLWCMESELEKVSTQTVFNQTALSEIPRYDLSIEEQYHGSGDLIIEKEKCSQGEWVKWSDIEKLLK